MIQYQIILAWLAATGAGVLAAAGVAVWCVERQVFPGRRLLGAFRRLPWFARVGLGAFVIQLIVYGSTKTNQTNALRAARRMRRRLSE